MKIDAKTCYDGIFPVYQQVIGAKFLWKVISDIAKEIFGKEVEDTHKLRDFAYGLVTILPVVGTIFNIFLYNIVKNKNAETAPPQQTQVIPLKAEVNQPNAADPVVAVVKKESSDKDEGKPVEVPTEVLHVPGSEATVVVDTNPGNVAEVKSEPDAEIPADGATDKKSKNDPVIAGTGDAAELETTAVASDGEVTEAEQAETKTTEGKKKTKKKFKDNKLVRAASQVFTKLTKNKGKPVVDSATGTSKKAIKPKADAATQTPNKAAETPELEVDIEL